MAGTDAALRLAGLNAAYGACIDADRLEEWPDFFMESCIYKVTTAENEARGYAAGIIYADNRAMLADRVTALRGANIYERQRYRHIIGMPMLRAAAGETSASTFAAETSFLIVRTMRDGRMDLFATGIYLDKVCTDIDGALRFAERIVVCDSQRFDTLVAIPL